MADSHRRITPGERTPWQDAGWTPRPVRSLVTNTDWATVGITSPHTSLKIEFHKTFCYKIKIRWVGHVERMELWEMHITVSHKTWKEETISKT
jgi:hypothetical protein